MIEASPYETVTDPCAKCKELFKEGDRISWKLPHVHNHYGDGIVQKDD